MTEEKKQALIEHIETDLELLRNVTLKHCHEVERECVLRDIEANEIALATLTATPVKLPRIEVCDLYATPYQKGLEAGATQLREEFIRNIRAAGYQVEGE